MIFVKGSIPLIENDLIEPLGMVSLSEIDGIELLAKLI
jgi:hypothetical protein